jgi:hypothetical protein
LRSSHIVTLVGGSRQQILRRLKLLYHHGFLERPRSQLDYYHSGASHEMIYGLGNKGAVELGVAFRSIEKNRIVGKIFLKHELLVSDMMVAVELACRKNGNVRLIHNEELSLPSDVRWKVKVSGFKLTVVPDRVFALDFDGNRLFFFLEADRGTMPVIRKNLLQTSFRRKLIAYEATWNQNLHQSRLGFNRFRVLTVTTSAKRVNSLVAACSQLKSGHGLFLFTDKTVLSSDILSQAWWSGRAGETGTLLN